MHKILPTLAFGALIVGTGAACSPSHSGTPVAVSSAVAAQSTTATALPTSLPQSVLDDIFVEVAKSADPSSPRAELINLGHKICESLDANITPMSVAMTLMETYAPKDAGTIMGAAVQSYCVEYTDALDRAFPH